MGYAATKKVFRDWILTDSRSTSVSCPICLINTDRTLNNGHPLAETASDVVIGQMHLMKSKRPPLQSVSCLSAS